ncbi:MAG: hypothetical protein KGI54_18905, partial [Pseudomonadota bacterium]|nr:hypothetical protein [Pseudomonadota bacterium]
DVNDDSFRKFFELFKEYSEKVEDMPESWKKLGNAMGSGMGKFNKLSKQSKESMAMSAANASLIVDELKKATHAQKQFHTATRQSQGAMHTLAKTTEKVGKTLFGLGKFMLGFGGVTSLLGGLGIGELSSIAFNRQRQARGLGMSIGQVQSFKANLNRYVDVGTLLENVANAKTDQTKWWAFSSMGIPINQAINEGTGRLSTQLMNRARSIWMQGPQTLQYAQAKGLTQFFSLDDLRRLAASSTGGLATAESSAFRNAASMGFSARTAREWSQLSIALTKAKLVVESALIRGLAPLAPQFSAMAKVTAKLISEFIESGKAKKYVHEFSDEMKKVVTFLGSKKFQSDLQRFEEAINDVTTGILKVAHFFGWGPKKPTGQTGNVGFSSPRANNYNYSMKGTMRVFGIPIPNQPLYMGPN